MSVQAELKMDYALSQFPFEMLCFLVPVWFSVIIFFKENTAMFLWTETIHKFVAKFKFGITVLMLSFPSVVYAWQKPRKLEILCSWIL